MYYSTPTVNVGGCLAHITKNRNRSKIYGDTVYLKTGETFEIELFNPSTTKVLARIEINGKKISDGGIILRPGERVYLERFIETNKKFLFETYEVEKSNESLNAVRENGMIEVSFYSEKVITSNNFTITGTNYPYYYSTGIIGNTGHLGSPASNIPFGGTTQNNLFPTTSSTENIISTNPKSSTIETGRIEMGESSNQKFNESYAIFNSFPSKNIKYRILPESQKPLESSSIRNYCTNCGVRMKKQTWKFCPNCGSKF
jgi:hypothetical protein